MEIRSTQEGDEIYLKQWLMEEDTLRWFPMINEVEVDDASKLWVNYGKNNAGFTALSDGVPCGMVVIYPAVYRKLSHQSLISIIVDKQSRGKGVGRLLMNKMMEHAKQNFQMELIHLEVYEDNPARFLYEKLGFVEYGRDTEFVKEDGKYLSKICMEKWI